MRKGSLIERYSYLVNLGVMLTQMLMREQGFRLRDVKFYCSLVSNWISFDGQGYDFDIELMQIKRMLEHLMERGWVRMLDGAERKCYRLERHGFIGMLESFRQQSSLASMEEVLLLNYVFETYRPYLIAYFQSGNLPEQEMERVLGLIDPDWFIENYLEHVEKRVQGIKRRIEENAAMTDFIRASQDAQMEFPVIVEQLHRKFSYQLSYAKTFRELLLEIPEDLGRYELSQGFESRNNRLFIALRDIYEQRRVYLQHHLQRLKAQRAKNMLK